MIINGNFEAQFSAWQGIGEIQLCDGWTPFWASPESGEPDWKNRRPEYKKATAPFLNRVYEGQNAQQWFTFSGTHSAGILQRVPVPSGAMVHLSAMGQVWSTNGDAAISGSPNNEWSNGHLELRIGLALDGDTNPWGDVVWSDWHECYDEYKKIELSGVAQSGYVTVFLMSECMWPVKHNDVYFDAVTLEVDGGNSEPPQDEIWQQLKRIADTLEKIAGKL